MGRLLIAFLLVAASAIGETIWVAQDASGLNDGSSSGNARSISWLNASTNWGTGAGLIGAGDTVMLSGTLTNTLLVGGSGTEGSPILIRFDTGAKFLSGSWPDPNGAIYLDDYDWITIYGGTIQATNNGTALGVQENASGIRGNGVTGIVVENVTITNIYSRTMGSADPNRYGIAIALQDSRDVTIQSNTLWGGDTMVAVTWTSGVSSNWTIRGNTIGGCNHGITLGTSDAGGYLHDVTIHGNRIDNLDLWDGESGLHLDGVIVFVESPSPAYDGWISNLVISANHIGPKIGVTNTAALFLDTYRPWQLADSKIINNLLTSESPYAGWNNGFISVGGATNTLVANNSMISWGTNGIGITFTTGGLWVTNNLSYQVATPVSLGSASSVPTGFTCDRNLWYGFKTDGSGAFYHPNYSAGTWASWTGTLGFDTHSGTNQPALDASYTPTAADTAARGEGVDLSSLFTTDATGSTRVAPWDIGAYEYVGTRATVGTVNVGTLIIAP